MTAGSVLSRLAPAALVIGLLGVAAPAQAGESSDVEAALAAIKAAHDKYQDPAVAVADGFMATDSCVTSDAGTMGFHYVNPKLMGPIAAAKPPILVYQPDGDGGRKLVAVEWFQPDADQDLSTSEDKPSLLGRAFDGPMEGHEPGMPRHYDMHAWLWQTNPAGTLEPWNKAGSCEGAETITKVPLPPMAGHAGTDSDDEQTEADDGQVAHKPTGGADTGGGATGTDQALLIGLGVAVAAGGLLVGAAGRRRSAS